MNFIPIQGSLNKATPQAKVNRPKMIGGNLLAKPSVRNPETAWMIPTLVKTPPMTITTVAPATAGVAIATTPKITNNTPITVNDVVLILCSLIFHLVGMLKGQSPINQQSTVLACLQSPHDTISIDLLS